MIAIVDYGTANVGSMANMLKKVGAESTITSDADVIARASKIILPGVGAFDAGMRNLVERGLIAVLREQVLERGTPFLGVCLGMQLIMRRSEEGDSDGLGWLPGNVVRFRSGADAPSLKVPHMGWNTTELERQDPLFAGLNGDSRFYFVHSFYVTCNPDITLARTTYGTSFVSAVRRGNIAGVQFHPEKSHRYGMQLLRNFAVGNS